VLQENAFPMWYYVILGTILVALIVGYVIYKKKVED
jgi:hypothetical protein